MAQTIADGTRRLASSAGPSAALEARVLLAFTVGLAPEDLQEVADKGLDKKEYENYEALLARRRDHEPIAYLIGKKEFWSLDFYVTPDTLIPRPDSETLVEAALKQVQDTDKGRAKPLTLLDLGTGTGCLLVTLLKELAGAQGVGVDLSPAALRVARINAERQGVSARARFINGRWCDAIDGTFDLIVCNPPYVAEGTELMPDVARFEPHLALFAGADGLASYRTLAPQLGKRLGPEGTVFLEMGQGQTAKVTKILNQAGLDVIGVKKDLAGIERCVVAQRDESAI